MDWQIQEINDKKIAPQMTFELPEINGLSISIIMSDD